MSNLAKKLESKFLVIDGPDGAGKTTQIELLKDFLQQSGLEVCQIRDPGGTVIGDRIREILLDRNHDRMCVECEMLLYMASRAQLAHELIRPALERGACVLSDRYISATVAYQGAGGADVKAIQTAGRIAVGGTMPDLTIVLDIESHLGLSRAKQVGQADRIESRALEYHQKVREMFLTQANDAPDRFAVVAAEGTIQDVQERLRETLASRF